MYKLIIYLSYCLFSAKKSVSVNFCETNKDLEYAFIIQNDVYFGVNDKCWTYNIESSVISESNTFKHLFGQNSIEALVTGFKLSAKLLNLKDCEDKPDSNLKCLNAKKAKDLVIVMYYANYVLYYYSFRYNTSTLTPIKTRADMPWSLPTDGKFETFVINYINYTNMYYLNDIYHKITKSYTLTGLTFIENDETLLVSVTNNSLSDGRIISIPLKSASIDSFDMKTKAFAGLFYFDNSIYALDYNNKIWFNDKYNLDEYFTAKEFFKCKDQPFVYSSERSSKQTPALTHTVRTTTELSSKQTSSESSHNPSVSPSKPSKHIKSKSKIWILYLFIYIIIAFGGVIVYLYCLSRITTNAQSVGSDQSIKSVPSNSGVEEIESIKSIEDVESSGENGKTYHNQMESVKQN